MDVDRGSRLTMKSRASWIAWIFFGFFSLAAIRNVVFELANPKPDTSIFRLVSDLLLRGLIPVVFAAIGALIVSRQPRNLIGWLLFAPAFSQAVSPLLPDVQSWTSLPSQITLIEYLALWSSGWGWMLLIFPIFLIMLLFPTGRPPSPRWNWVGYLALSMVTVFIFFATFGHTFMIEDASLEIPNPIGFIPSFITGGPVFMALWGVGLLVVAVASVSSLIVRYRRAKSIEREQIKWLLYACALFGGLYAIAVAIYIGGGPLLIGTSVYEWLLWLALAAIPVAIAIAILRYRLWDIDVIIRKTLVYGLLTVALALLYFGLVTLLQSLSASVFGLQSPVIIVLSTLAIAALFNPLRIRIQNIIDWRFYRRKYNAEQAMAQFAAAARNETDIKCLNEALLQVMQETMQPEKVQLWLKPIKKN